MFQKIGTIVRPQDATTSVLKTKWAKLAEYARIGILVEKRESLCGVAPDLANLNNPSTKILDASS